MTIRNRFGGLPAPTRLALGGAVLLALGAAGGAGAVSLTRPGAVMAPTVTTPVSRLAAGAGVVTIKGRVAEIYGNRFVVQDASGRALVDAGPAVAAVERGRPIMVQGRFDRGQLRAAYLVTQGGRVEAVGPLPPPPHGGSGHDGPPPPPPHGGPGHDGPPPPPDHDGPPRGSPGAPPPPPGCAPLPAPGAVPAPASGPASVTTPPRN